MTKKKKQATVPSVCQPPTWRQTRDAIGKLIEKAGGTKALANEFSWDTYYTLVYLLCLQVDGPVGDEPLLLPRPNAVKKKGPKK